MFIYFKEQNIFKILIRQLLSQWYKDPYIFRGFTNASTEFIFLWILNFTQARKFPLELSTVDSVLSFLHSCIP
jgi:hypothetical protein